MTFSDWLLILATMSGPVLAVQAQKFIERATARRDAQRRIFRDLRATRATRIAPAHVQALNMIDLEFRGTGWRIQTGRERAVVDAWRNYADHLNSLGEKPNEALVVAWSARGNELFVDLLAALSTALGYSFNRVELSRGIYRPIAHNEADVRNEVMQRALTDVLTGTRPLRMSVTDFPVSKEAMELQEKVQTAILNAIGEGAVKVKSIE
jgi:hypothetical protein